MIGVAGMVVLMFLRVPVAAALGLVGWGGLVWLKHVGAADAVMSRDSFAMVLDFNLTTIATFMLMGYLTFAAGFTRDLYDTTRIWFSRTAGGLAVASIVGCASFAAVSGSSLATAAAMGKIAVPEMLRRGYDKGLATGVIAASGTLGSLIPPSVLMILYAVFTGESIALLFIAGVIPGVLSAGIYVTMILIRARLNPKLAPGMATSTTWSQKFRSLKGACAIVVLFIIVMGGIMTGFFTPMEAGAFGAAGAFSIAMVSGRMTYRRFKTAMQDVLRQAAAIFAIIFGAIIFARFMALSNIGQFMAERAGSVSDQALPVIAAMSVIYVILGTFMGPLEIMLITLPIVKPVVASYDLSLIWFGIIMIKYLEIGLITPPLGFNVFIVSSVVGRVVPITTIFKGVAWFLAMDVATLALLILVPGITLFLPDLYLDWTAFLRTSDLGAGEAIGLWLTGGLEAATAP